MAKKSRTRGRSNRKKIKKAPKHVEDFRIISFLTVVTILFVLLTKTYFNTELDYKCVIKDVISEQVGNTERYNFYYTVANPTSESIECDVVIEVSGKSYLNKVALEPKQELYTMTNVQMSGEENSIKITSTSK